MHTFRVWAPLPKEVSVQVGRKKFAATADANGWWTAEVSPARTGSDYGFILDGEGPFPDPSSAWQPHGVHGLSRLVDHGSFRWSDRGWRAPPLGEAVIYELHVGTFTPQGTFAAVIQRLDHLVDLGITHLELMPVNAFPGARGWGYDGVEPFAPQHAYGGPNGLKRLVDACHGRGVAVILDVVYNHFGPSGNYLGRFAPYFTSNYSTPWGCAINFAGEDSDEVRRYFCNNALMWLRDYHLDGLRLDAVHAIHDTLPEPFLEQLNNEVKQLEAHLERPLVLIAESAENDPRLLWPAERGGFGLDAQWNDDFHHALHTALTGETQGYYDDFRGLADLAKALTNAYVYAGQYSRYRRRRHGRPPVGLSGHRFVGYLQNHDQIGNRVQGERSSHLLSMDLLKVGAALVLTSPFIPMLFQGEEWAASSPFLYFTDHQEAGLAKAVREGRRRECAAVGGKLKNIPDPQAGETFKRSKLRWPERLREPHASLLGWHRRLIRLRRLEPALNDGRRDLVQVQADPERRWLLVERGPISVVCNLAGQPRTIPIRGGGHEILLASKKAIEVMKKEITLPPESVAILKRLEEFSRNP